jgi:hypothetical protein
MTMIDRRQMLAGGLLVSTIPALARAALPVPAGNRLGFDIVRKGARLGSHVLTFSPGGDGLVVHVAVEIVYKIMGLTLYHYAHHATEIWSGDQVVAVESNTDDNGEKYQVAGRREASGFVIQGSKIARYVAPANAMPATHWNRRELDGPWINTQDGKLLRPRIVPGATETIPAANGATGKGRHYTLTGDAQLDMWYDDRLGWTGLSFTRSGTIIRYERQA